MFLPVSKYHHSPLTDSRDFQRPRLLVGTKSMRTDSSRGKVASVSAVDSMNGGTKIRVRGVTPSAPWSNRCNHTKTSRLATPHPCVRRKQDKKGNTEKGSAAKEAPFEHE